ncbi:type II secretion system F family protein [Nocardia sp. CDC159]|uniref:Type II secretion system F family protein n=1 Tax=Nocardia pulmonis TaxID=2951408 RepID=A0A9X2E2L1_9NOCA|nr:MULTISPECIES: type II secretion system F family protein [Nocardia]MCM6772744.1 type II secretion system F family protein [Nocardia pulmonis]MCM6785953.1 type II secretion system F family protein [Nocardia sp. CDC159]
MTASPLILVLLGSALLVMPGPRTGVDRLRAVLGKRRRPASRPVRTVVDPLATASAFDLLAACLRAGLPVATAARAVAPAAAEPMRTSLRQAAELLALGADPAAAWLRASRDSAELAALARLVRRSARSGSALAGAVAELAEHCRAQVEDAAAARAERAGVLIGGPLGLCFLPAFLCLGIAPVVIGLAGRLLGGGLL